ncbi:MAG: CD225/dispanin family protein [Sodaliphilus pleomorphus]|uniref:CD225/dispanin family protein n=1 Tax=Sodaliphilus pleomorphus TaxID=2606626 RepID=UPI002409A35A|nr:CD225/dispanin family protein [Sodaliphilus pleomorphus]MDD6475353.1 CD225/dispanin family protein [Sodaliphilus pleomorphus]
MKYYMHTGGQQLGPFEESELPSHGLTASTMVWREGMPDWVAASQVPELSHLLPPIQQPPTYQPQPGYGPQSQRPAMPDTYLVWAILATLLCCMPFGIVSIVKASQVSSLYYQGNYAEARAASRAARNWAIASAVSSGAIVLVYVAVFFGAVLIGQL